MKPGKTPPFIPSSVVFRHAGALLLLYPAWHFLSRWYYYQHSSDYVWFLVVALPALVLAGWRAGPSLWKTFPRMKLLLICAFCLLLMPWGEWLGLGAETSANDWSRQLFLQVVSIYVLCLVFSLFPWIPGGIAGGISAALDRMCKRPWIYGGPPVLFFLITLYTSFFILERVPVIQDSAAHLFQAAIFLHGKLVAPLPPHPEFFDFSGDMLVMQGDRWFSMYQPGFSLLLALGMLVRSEWLVSPLIGAATLALWISYTYRWYGPRLSLVVGFLGCVSPFLLLMSSSYMVFVPELFFASVILYLCRLYAEMPRSWYLLALFSAAVFVMLIRTFSTLPFIAPAILYTGWITLRRRSVGFLLSIGAGFAVGFAALMYFQLQTTGDAFLPGYLVEYPDVGLGFGEHWSGQHTPARGLVNVSNDFLGVNEWLTGWHTGTLFFVIATMLRHRQSKWDQILLLCCIGLAAFYFFFFFQDLLFGPRYFYPLSFVCLIFVARSMFKDDSHLDPFVTSLIALSVFSFLFLRLSSYLHTYNVEITNAGLLNREIQQVESETLVFLDRGVRNHFVNWNDPFLSKPAIIARDLGQRNLELMEEFPKYKPAYFRKVVDLQKQNVQTEFRLFDHPDPSVPGFLSFFDLAVTIQAPEYYPDQDFFDTTYDDFFGAFESEQQLNFLAGEMEKLRSDLSIRGHFHRGLIHIARVLILPRLAFERKVKDWQEVFDPSEFRNQFELAIVEFQAAKDIGQSLLHQMERVQIRMDRDGDDMLSDQEITRYLSRKMDPFIAGKP